MMSTLKLVLFSLLVGAIIAQDNNTASTQQPLLGNNETVLDHSVLTGPDTASTQQPPLGNNDTVPDHSVLTGPVRFDFTLNKHWNMWKTAHKKSYHNQVEELRRRRLWEKTLKNINTHNQEAALGLHTYTLAINHLADLTEEERLKIIAPLKLPEGFRMTPTPLGDAKLDLPDSVDWRRSGYVTSVKDQGACGSSWAFSATAALEGLLAKTTGSRPVDLSPQNLLDCSWNYGNQGCNGGWPHSSFQYVIDNNGIDSWVSYSYQMQVGYCRYDPSNRAAGCSSYHFVEMDEQTLKQAVATIGPISVALDASDFSYYSSGVYDNATCGQTLNHAVLLVGYGTDLWTGQDFWLIKNSWGPGWGERGYIRLARNKGQMCGISHYAVYPL